MEYRVAGDIPQGRRTLSYQSPGRARSASPDEILCTRRWIRPLCTPGGLALLESNSSAGMVCANPARRWMSSLRFLVITEGSQVTALYREEVPPSPVIPAWPGSGARPWPLSRPSVLFQSACLSAQRSSLSRYLLRRLFRRLLRHLLGQQLLLESQAGGRRARRCS